MEMDSDVDLYEEALIVFLN